MQGARARHPPPPPPSRCPQAGEEFEGAGEHQWDRLYGIAKSVLGSSVSRRLLKRLVTSYLGQ